ncbi:hypothetical protein BG005_001354 [Podila minutissima]|nr:hypothetical protein BG005_001354 [Podila minutissima]
MAQRPLDADDELRQAAKTVDEQLAREQKYPELGNFFSTDFSSAYIAPESRQQVLRRKRAISLPDNLFEQYNLIQCRCFMGLFPEINRVWITIDHRLFLWNYADGGDYESFEELDQIIVNVALVKPKKGIFDSKIEYLLVIATPVDVHLLGLGTGSGSTPHTLYITNMSVPSDNVAMRTIVGTEDGRIFMNGNDGRLWEINYQAEEGWFSKKCYKTEVLGSALSYFKPTFAYLSRNPDPIVKIVFDETRQVMYGLTEKSNIEVMSLSNSTVTRSTIDRNDILKDSRRKSSHNRALDESQFKIVDIHTISTIESRDICLVGITSTGCRLYFGISYNRSHHDQSKSILPLQHVRIPPTFDSVPAGALGVNGQYQIHQSLYRNGIFLAAHAFSDAADALIASAPDSGPINKESTETKPLGTSYIPRLTETAMISSVEGKIWAMTEVPGVNFAGAIDSSILRNELAVQLSRSPREYLVLTNSGVNVFTKRRPVDILQQLLLEGRGAESEVAAFFNNYGRVESSAMCIAILCGHPGLSPVSGSQYMAPHSAAVPIAANAEKWLLEQGGKREPLQSLGNERILSNGLSGSDLGRPVAQGSSGQFTYRYSAFSLYLARLLRPIWKRKVVKTANAVRQLYDTEISEDVLTSVQTTLFALRDFLYGHAELFTRRYVPNTNPPSENDRIELQNAEDENRMMKALARLLTQAIEGIAFVLFLVDSKMSETVSKITPEDREILTTITYETLLTTAKGHDLCRRLVTAIINKQMGHHMSVDAVSDTLQRICGSFCNTDDVILFQATEHQRLAKSLQNPADAQDSLQQALRLFKKVPFLLVGESGSSRLRETCQIFMEMGYPQYAVELALSCAHDVDPSNKATGYCNDGMNPKDIRNEQYNQRMVCYESVAMVLTGVGLRSAQGSPSEAAVKAISTALQFDDNIFHTYLYDWLLSYERTDYLLEIESPYIVDFLQECTKLDKYKDLLSTYYTKHEDFGLAAKELGRIAEAIQYKLTFFQRLEYLSRAVSNAKSYPAGSDPKTENGKLLIDLEEKLEVGNIQLEIILSLQATLERLERKVNNVMASNSSREEARQEFQEIDSLRKMCESQLLDVNGLYHNVAEPLKMYESMLAIYHASELDDEYHVRGAWEGFIAKVFDEAVVAGRPPLTDIEVRVKELGRRFYPSATVTPIKTMVQILERYPYLKQTAAYPASSQGWAVRILREIGFPYEALFDTFHGLIETKVKEWMAPRASLVLIQDIEILLREWLTESHGSRIIAELNDELGIVETDRLVNGAYTNGATSRGGMGSSVGVGSGPIDRFRIRKIDEAIQTYIRMLESASWTPTAISGPFDDNLGGPKVALETKAAQLVRRLQAIRNKIQRIN